MAQGCIRPTIVPGSKPKKNLLIYAAAHSSPQLSRICQHSCRFMTLKGKRRLTDTLSRWMQPFSYSDDAFMTGWLKAKAYFTAIQH